MFYFQNVAHDRMAICVKCFQGIELPEVHAMNHTP